MAADYALAPERTFRRPGCGSGCHMVRATVVGEFGRCELLIHDPDAHEVYGRMVERGIRNGSELLTGPLTVDLSAARLTAGGVEIHCTATEWRLFAHLARNVGRLCSSDEITTAIWGDGWFPTRADACHRLRIDVSRLRSRMGGARYMVETRPGRGYLLRLDPPCALVGGRPGTHRHGSALPPGAWSRHHERCKTCGETTFRHWGHGICSRCRIRRRAGEEVAS